MAEDARAKDEEGAPPGVGSGAPARALQGATAPPRAKPMIEGEALRAETRANPVEEGRQTADELLKDASNTASPSHSGAAPGAEPEAVLSSPAEAAQGESAEAEGAAADAQADLPPSRDFLSLPRSPTQIWPIAAAVVVGALIGVAGGFGLHSLEKPSKALVALEERVAALEQRPQPAAAAQAGDRGLDARVDVLQSGAQSMTAALARLEHGVQHLETAQKQLEAAQKASFARPTPSVSPVDLAPLSARMGKLEGEFAALDLRVRDLATKFEAESRAAQVAKDRAAQMAAARAEANAVAIIAADLRRKVEAGSAFGDDLAALGNHGVDKETLAALEPAATTGVASPEALAKQFSAAAPHIIATEPEPKGEGFFGRLARDAAHLVRIQKIGDATGHDLAAHVARIKAALDRGAVEAALQEWDDLPAAAKAKSQAFGAAAQQRVAALGAAKAIEADALAALAKAKN